MTSVLPSSLLSRVLALTQHLPVSLPLPSFDTLRKMGASWSDSIDASITIQADPALVLSLLQSAASDPLYANPNICTSLSPPSSPTKPPLHPPYSPATPTSAPYPTELHPLHSSTVRLLLPFVLDDTHTFRIAASGDGEVTLEQRELLSGVVVWLGRMCGMAWYRDMLEETRSGYEQWNVTIKRMAEEQHQQQQQTALEAH